MNVESPTKDNETLEHQSQERIGKPVSRGKTFTPVDCDKFSNLKSRSPFLAEQREMLEKIFSETKYISSNKRKQIAKDLKLTERQIKVGLQMFSALCNGKQGSICLIAIKCL